MGTTGKAMEVKTQRKMDGERQSMVNYGLTEEDIRDIDMWCMSDSGEVKPPCSAQFCNEYINVINIFGADPGGRAV